MDDLITGLRLALVIEGALWATAPGLARFMAREISDMPDAPLRMGGAAVVAVGVFIVWLVRG